MYSLCERTKTAASGTLAQSVTAPLLATFQLSALYCVPFAAKVCPPPAPPVAATWDDDDVLGLVGSHKLSRAPSFEIGQGSVPSRVPVPLPSEEVELLV